MIIQSRESLYNTPILDANSDKSIMLVLDLDSNYIACCKNFARYSGYNMPESLQGLSAWDMRNNSLQAQASVFNEQDKRVISSGKSEYNVVCFKQQDSIFHFSTKKELILLPNKTPIGIMFKAYSLAKNFCKKIYDSVNDPYIKDSDCLSLSEYPYFKLTTRESHCLYYVIRGRCNSEIATLLNISKRTVEDYIEKLRYKMNCGTKRDIIEKAIDLNLQKIIPAGLL